MDWSKYGGTSATAAPIAASTPKPSGIDWSKYGGTPTAPPSEPSGNPFAPVAHAAKAVATGVGNVLDAQRYGVARLLTGKDNTDDQRTAERTGAGTQGIYDAIGHIPGVGHFLQGASDVVQDTVTDPLTYETLGAGPVLKALGLADKLAAGTARVGKAVTDTPLGAAVHDFTHWGGPVARERGSSMVNRLRGTANMAGAEGSAVQKKLMADFDAIDKGLSDEERVRVGKALNGEQLAKGGAVEPREALTPKEQTAYDGLRSLTEQDLEHRTRTAQVIAFNAATKGMPTADRDLLAKALRENKPPELPAPEKRTRVNTPGTSVSQRSRAVNANVPIEEPVENLGQPRTGKLNIGQLPHPHEGTFTRPIPNQAEIDRMTKLRDLYTTIQSHVEQKVPRREDYFPTTHPDRLAQAESALKEAQKGGDEAAIAKAQKAVDDEKVGGKSRTVNAADYSDPRTKSREDIHVTDAAQMRSGFEAMAKNTGRQVKNRIVNEQLDHLLDDPEIRKLFDTTIKASGNLRTNPEKIKDAWLSVIGYPRAATVSLTPRHIMNIMDLAANTVPPHLLPEYTKNVTALTAKLLRAKSEEEYQALTKDGRELGALSGDFRERHAFFQNIPGLKHWTAANNKLVWAIDEAAKTEYAKLLIKTGEAQGLEAGGLASSRLVDYAHHSPLVEALRYVAPFGTFRGSVPGAVMGGLARNPARAALLNRATGGTMYGGKPAKGQQGAEFYGPTSDVARGLDAPQDFLRGTLGAPIQAAATMGMEAATGNPGASVQTTMQELRDLPNQIMRGQFSKTGTPGKVSPYAKAVALRTAQYLNYKNPIDLRWIANAALAGVPEAGMAVQQLGGSQFAIPKGTPVERIAREILRQSAGVSIR